MLQVSFIKSFLMCTLVLACSAPSRASEEEAFPAKCSTAKGRMRRALALDEPHVRKRRTIEVPEGTAWECKWAINIPFETQKRYTAKLQVAIPININIPSFLFDERGLEKLLGFYKEEEGEGAKERMSNYTYDPDFDATIFGSHPESSSGDFGQSRPIELPKTEYLAQVPSQGASGYHRRTARSVAYSRAIQSERMELYYRVEGLLNKLGVPGSVCLQRTICELAQQPIEQGVVGDFVNLFLTPSLSTLPQEIEDFGKLEDYVKAERHGEGGGHCSARYEDCPASMFELLPVVANSLFSL